MSNGLNIFGDNSLTCWRAAKPLAQTRLKRDGSLDAQAMNRMNKLDLLEAVGQGILSENVMCSDKDLREGHPVERELDFDSPCIVRFLVCALRQFPYFITRDQKICFHLWCTRLIFESYCRHK